MVMSLRKEGSISTQPAHEIEKRVQAKLRWQILKDPTRID